MRHSGHELLALYGFSVKYPNTARLELNPKAGREKGDVVFHLDGGFKIFLSWGSLEEARKQYASAAAQASDSIERSVSGGRGRLDGTPETKKLKVKGHEAVYTHARMVFEQRGLLFGTRHMTQDAYALHVHCKDSGRYYVLYAFARPETSEQIERAFEPVMSSLKCHSS
jgi:hypothetical protein